MVSLHHTYRSESSYRMSTQDTGSHCHCQSCLCCSDHDFILLHQKSMGLIIEIERPNDCLATGNAGVWFLAEFNPPMSSAYLLATQSKKPQLYTCSFIINISRWIHCAKNSKQNSSFKQTKIPKLSYVCQICLSINVSENTVISLQYWAIPWFWFP